MKFSLISLALLLVLGLSLGSPLFSVPAHAAGESISLYTPYTNISAPPGESVNYSIEIINNSEAIQTVKLGLNAPDAAWEYELTAGGHSIQEISVKPKETQTVSLQLKVPYEVNKGAYKFQVNAEGAASLPLVVNVSEQGTFKTELTSSQTNMEGHAGSNFTFSATLMNRTADKQLYALQAAAPQGWDVQFNVGGKSVSSVDVEANAQSSIDVAITPPDQVKAGSYKIPMHAESGATNADLEFEVVITGSYAIDLSTPTGLLSTSVTAGQTKKLDLLVTNKGTAELTDIQLSAQTPTDWEVTFDNKTIKKLEAGKSATVQATIKADKKAIAGDYVVNMNARTAEKSSDVQFRVAVKTSVLWGWLGIIIIVLVLGGIYYLFRTYGRR